MRYQVIRVILSPKHPHWPNEFLFKIWDNFAQKHVDRVLLGCYTTKERADTVANRLNEKFSENQDFLKKLLTNQENGV